MFYGNKKKSQLFFVHIKRVAKVNFIFNIFLFFKILFLLFHPCNKEQMKKERLFFP